MRVPHSYPFPRKLRKVLSQLVDTMPGQTPGPEPDGFSLPRAPVYLKHGAGLAWNSWHFLEPSHPWDDFDHGLCKH